MTQITLKELINLRFENQTLPIKNDIVINRQILVEIIFLLFIFVASSNANVVRCICTDLYF